MSESKYLFERVKKAATKAIEAERNGDYKIAFDAYLLAADLLNQLIKIEKSQKIRDSYYSKAKEYIRKAKEIKTLLLAPPKVITPTQDLPPTPKDTASAFPPPSSTTTASSKTIPPTPPPPKDEPSVDFTSGTTTSFGAKDVTAKIMRGEEDLAPTREQLKDDLAFSSKQPQKKEIQAPTKTTFEILYDEGKYRECIIECSKSVEAELRVRMGLFDGKLTLGMLIEKGIQKGMNALLDFKYVNILLNRIVHENYRPKQEEALKAVEITSKILMS